MRHRFLASLALSAALAFAFPAIALIGQSKPAAKPAAPASGKWSPTRLADGHPDLQGVWSYATITPLERPAELADKEFLTAEEARAYEKQVIGRDNKDLRPENKTQDVGSAYNDFWWDRGTNIVGTRRTSLIVDPRDGKLPPLTAEGQERRRAGAEARRNRGAADGPEDRNMSERCLISLNAGPPMVPSAYNNNVQLFQTPQFVAFTNEMIHNYRVVPMDNRPQLGRAVHQWMGDSRGHWDGDTLVVETTNWRSDSAPRGGSEALRVTERFTRLSAQTMMYEFTLEDPKTWTKPWTGQIPMSRIDDKLYEYACHEGNHAMEHMLTGARAEESAAQDATRKSSK